MVGIEYPHYCNTIIEVPLWKYHNETSLVNRELIRAEKPFSMVSKVKYVPIIEERKVRSRKF